MKNFPNAFVIILSVIVLSWLLTFIIPKGSYERIVDVNTEQTTVVPNSYQQTEAPHLSAFDLMLAIPKGIIGRADLMVLILLLGGCFFIIEKTGALNQGLNQMIVILHGKESLALAIITLLFVTAGFTIALQEEVIAMTPILLLFGRNLGYNALTMIFASYGSTVVGSAFSPFNPFGVLVAQKEAQVELLSGTEFRLIFLAIATLIWIVYILRYARNHRIEKSSETLQVETLSVGSKLILSLLALAFGVVTYGLISLGWGFNEMSACFFVLAILCGLIAKLGFNKTTELYVEGFKEMIFACIIIGLANSITIIFLIIRIVVFSP